MTAASAKPALSKAQMAYSYIRERITSGQFPPGYRLVLGQIADELAVSVVPVREAIRLLEAECLVTFERNVGAQVAMIDANEYCHALQTLSIIEAAATALAAPHIPAKAIRQARAIDEKMSRCIGRFDPVRFAEFNFQFHSTLFEYCSNPRLLDMVRLEWNRVKALRNSIFTFVPGRARDSVAEHEKLLRLIERRAPALEIEAATRAHRTATMDAFLAWRKQHGGETLNPGELPRRI
jgi:DNA-binding GntR family transcriptional regulator